MYSFDGGGTYQNSNVKYMQGGTDTYSVMTKSSTGCVSSATPTTIVMPPKPVILWVDQPTCESPVGRVVVVQQNLNDLYSLDGQMFSSSFILYLGPGSQNVSVRNQNGCQSEPSAVYIDPVPAIPSAPQVTITQPTCTVPTGAISVVVQNQNASYSFDNGLTFQSENIKVGLAPETYQVSIKNSDGCTSAKMTSVVNPQPLVPAAPTVLITQPTCTLGTASISVTLQNESDIYSFDEGVTFQSANNKAGVIPGNYKVLIKNSAGCASSVISTIVNMPPVSPGQPILTLIHPTCTIPTASILISKQNEDDIYSFDDGLTFQTGNNKSGLTGGNHKVLIKNSVGCSSVVISAIINIQPASPGQPVLTITHPTCSIPTGSILISKQNDSDIYSFDDGLTFQASNNKSGLIGGNQKVLIKNSIGCSSAVISAIINMQPASPGQPVLTITHPTCTISTGSILILKQNESDIYSFDDGVSFQANNFESAMSPGAHHLIIQNVAGCKLLKEVSINKQPPTPDKPTITLDLSDPSKPMLSTSQAFSYNWFKDGALLNGVISNPINTTEPGSFSVVVTNAENCSSQPSESTEVFVVTGVNKENILVRVYPNPVQNLLTIDTENFSSGRTTGTIKDLQGRTMREFDLSVATKINIDTKDYAVGRYVLIITNGVNFFTFGFIVHK
jgi:hypothetical protein